jgi:uncharacterized damage-inducible protein DinB
MLSRESLGELLRHMEWADARVWAAVSQAQPADARLQQLLTHIHTVQRAFLTVWSGGDVNRVLEHANALLTLPDVLAWARTYYPEAHAFVGALGDDRLGEPIAMPWAAQIESYLGRPPAITTVAETCFQVTSHTTYHRGQVNARLRELGGEPPLVDYIAWLWAGRPPAEWNAA